MGVIVTESIELGVGLSVDSYYISLDGNDIRIQRIQQRHEEVLKSTFQIETSFTSWISKEAKDAGTVVLVAGGSLLIWMLLQLEISTNSCTIS